MRNLLKETYIKYYGDGWEELADLADVESEESTTTIMKALVGRGWNWWAVQAFMEDDLKGMQNGWDVIKAIVDTEDR